MQNPRNSLLKAWYELLSSMRFAISLLTVLSIASVIGTVLKQGDPYSNYVFQFGPFWFKVFESLGLYDVYHTWWFLTILVFLVLSTGLCLYRNTPSMLREIKTYREHVTESSLRLFAHRAEWQTQQAPEAVLDKLSGYLGAHGYRFKTVVVGEDRLLAAKSGGYRRLGYIFAHSALIIICIGGLVDGNIPLKIAQVWGIKQPETRDLPESQVGPASRLHADSLSFRGSVSIPEGKTSDVVFINAGEGYYVQELPFAIRLRKFHIEHYPTGQPKSFVSDVDIVDKATGKATPYTIAVNHPLAYKGVTIYQASFDDGGSKLALKGWNLLSSDAQPFPFKGVVKESALMSNGNAAYTVEFSDFRMFNIESVGDEEKGNALHDGMSAVQIMSSSRKVRNVGPSVRFTVRNSQGQATEYNNYMQPISVDGRAYFMTGMRGSPAEPFRYLRFPADEKGEIGGFMGLRAVLFDKGAYPEIAKRFAARALPSKGVDDTLRARFLDSTEKVLQLFAAGGYDGLARFIEKSVPAADQDRAAQTYLKVLESAAFEAYQLSRERAKLPPVQPDDNALRFVRDSLNAVSDSFFYGSPVYFQLTDFVQVQASGFQLTRSPGRNIVYLGSALLVLGVFVMFYLRERRLWLLVKSERGEVLLAMSSNRKTLDFEREFEQHKQHLTELLKD